jgi:endogenous inhibitor of DNA gyrase (YacG/DUF329 family)
MDCPAKSNTVNNALCELFYPYGCGTRCKNLYKRWMKTEKEVQEIENKGVRGIRCGIDPKQLN